MNTEDITNGVGLLSVFNLLEFSSFDTSYNPPPNLQFTFKPSTHFHGIKYWKNVLTTLK